MTPVGQLEALIEKLSDPQSDIASKYQAATDLCDANEQFQSADYERYLRLLVPAVVNVLEKVPPSFVTVSIEQKLRSCFLVLLLHLNFNDQFRTYAVDISKLLVDVLRNDNEENAVLAIKINIEVHRAYKFSLDEAVQPFIDFCLDLYDNMPNVVREGFEGGAANPLSGTPGSNIATSPMTGIESNDSQTKTLPLGMNSFKPLAECPIFLVMLMQTYRQLITPSLHKIVLAGIHFLQLYPSAQTEYRAREAASGRIAVGTAPEIRNKVLYGDFMTAKVKTTSVLAYVLRLEPSVLKPVERAFADLIVHMLEDCPAEMANLRKELLVAIRHAFGTDFKLAFLNNVDVLANEKVLIGTGFTAHETLKPLAFSMFADLCHHVRAELTLDQTRKAIIMYATNLQDFLLPTSIQTMCAKLLLNLVERVMKYPDKAQARSLLLLILDGFSKKLLALNERLDGLIERMRVATDRNKSYTEDFLALIDSDILPFDQLSLMGRRPVRLNSVTALEETTLAENIRDSKHLFKCLITGLKTIIYGIRSCNPPVPATILDQPQEKAWNLFARGSSSEEIILFRNILRSGLQGFRVYSLDDKVDNKISDQLHQNAAKKNDEEVNHSSSIAREEKELMDSFAHFFIHIDPSTFVEVFEPELPFLFSQLLKNPALTHLIQSLLVNETATALIGQLLVPSLLEQLPKLGSGDSKTAQLLFRLFRLFFMAVSLFPERNEAVLLPYLSKLIINCLKLASEANLPMEYFSLLKGLFRSIGGGRFEALYKEVLPLLEYLLLFLNSLIALARDDSERDLYVELCLTVPVRLSVLLPHLSYLMRPLVIALRGNHELVSQGLRTIELCVDNLTQDFLDPIMAPVYDELMEALWKHLKPLPHNHQYSHTVVRILGKLGGRNRKTIQESHEFLPENTARISPAVPVMFVGGKKPAEFDYTQYIDVAIRALQEKCDISKKKLAFDYLVSAFKMMIPISDVNAPIPTIMKQHVKTLLSKKANDEAATSELILTEIREIQRYSETRPNPLPKVYGTNNYWQKIMEGFFDAADNDFLYEKSKSFLFNAATYFAVVELHESVEYDRRMTLEITELELDALEFISVKSFALVIAKALCSSNEVITELGRLVLQKFVDTAASLLGSVFELSSLRFMHELVVTFRHFCYLDEWWRKIGGVKGIRCIIDIDIGPMWLNRYLPELLRALLYVIKDTPEMVAPKTIAAARECLIPLLEYCNPDKSFAESSPQRFQQILGVIIVEIANANEQVRAASHDALHSLAKLTDLNLTNILTPVKDRTLPPILSKPLRALSTSMQTGHVDAINFCLNLNPPLLEYDDSVMRLLNEALALAEAEDEEMITAGKTALYISQTALIKLRVGCANLLTTVIGASDFAGDKYSAFRGRIIAVLFKALYSTADEVVAAANAGLKQVLAQNHKLPKEILQAGLRPILMNLADHKRLTTSGLDGLARLLELLTNYFKVEIGKKLLDHLRAWAIPTVLYDASSFGLRHNPAVSIISAILNIFHLLPPAAKMFLEELVILNMELETHLRRVSGSPLREPLLKYLNRFSQDAWVYFADRLHQVDMGTYFSQLLEDESSGPLRSIIMEDYDRLFAIEDQAENGPSKLNFATNLILILKAIISHEHNWFKGDKSLRFKVLHIATKLVTGVQKGNYTDACLRVDLAVSAIIDQFIVDLTLDFDIPFILAIAKSMSEASLPLHKGFSDFLFENIVLSTDIKLRRTIIMNCLDVFSSSDSSPQWKTVAIKQFITPILIIAYARDEPDDTVFDKSVANALNSKVWKTVILGTDCDLHKHDELRMEIIQLTTLVIKNSSATISHVRKEAIKVGWSFIKVDEITIKHAAYTLISNFIAVYDCPAKIVVQVYNALLRTTSPEVRSLVGQALDTIATVLPKRAPEGTGYPPWNQWPKRVLSEEPQNVQQHFCIYNFIAKHGDLFYPYREQYVAVIIAPLMKLAFGPPVNTESKTLAIDLVKVLLEWETGFSTETEDLKASNKKADVLMSTVTSIPSSVQRETVISFLVRFACYTQDTTSKHSLNRVAIQLMQEFVKHPQWKQINTKISVLDRSLVQLDITDQTLPTIINALDTLRVLLAKEPGENVLGNIGMLSKVLERGFACNDQEFQDAFQPLLVEILLSANFTASNAKSEELDLFMSFISNSVQENLTNVTNVNSTVRTLVSLAKGCPNMLIPLLPSAQKLFQRLVREHVAPSDSTTSPFVSKSAEQVASNSATPISINISPEIVIDLVCHILELISHRVSLLGDQRRWFLSGMVQLIERSSNERLCQKVLDVVEYWVLKSQDSFPTIKEKTALLTKMSTFENRACDVLLKRFLNIVATIYEKPSNLMTELTVRLESAFLMGTRIDDQEIRNRFLNLFDKHLSRNIYTRLHYIFSVQNWEHLAHRYWLSQANHLLCCALDETYVINRNNYRMTLYPISQTKIEDEHDMIDNKFERILSECITFLGHASTVRAVDFMVPLQQLQLIDPREAHKLWIDLYDLSSQSLPITDRLEYTKPIISLLAQEFHTRQLEKRPNVAATILEGIAKSEPQMRLPPHLVKYLGTTFDAWYIALHILENYERDEGMLEATNEASLDALAEIYATLIEDDMFYGLWRRRCQFLETNAAMSYEQIGSWDKALQIYETAQMKARTGVLPFSESEYYIWEDHWILCAEKLQQWDILAELAKHEGYTDLLLEATWRMSDSVWTNDKETIESSIKALMDYPSPRRYIFEAFITLQKILTKPEAIQDFTKICEDGVQLSLRKWSCLPSRVTEAHIPLLDIFQMFVELHEGSQIYTSLAQTRADNLDTKSADLKTILALWRDRLPNICDNINVWSDLVAWRQLVFRSINRTYLPLVPALQQGSGNSANTNSFAYRGYHEMAWIINRFAHVARKHQLLDVCINQLTKIYTLPNIEIQEAFLKLREQAKCYYLMPNSFTTGLEVISNTNLMYFGNQQKAEFYTLKGMFLAKLNLKDEANQAFATAIQIDMTLAKGWSEWGHFNDRKFKEQPNDIVAAYHAVSCYLQAAGLFRNGKARKILSRVLWLLSLDDANGTVSKAFEGYKGDIPVWYWITFVPQLLTSLSHKEARHARVVLIKIARTYPQALHFQLRTTKEDYTVIKRQALAAASQASTGKSGITANGAVGSRQGVNLDDSNSKSLNGKCDKQTENGSYAANNLSPNIKVKSEDTSQGTNTPGSSVQSPGVSPFIAQNRQPWEHVEEIMTILKTAHPLLALSMEQMVDQIQQRFKCPADEDAYRLIVALLNDGVSYMSRLVSITEDTPLPPAAEVNISRFAESRLPKYIKGAFEEDFIKEKQNLGMYVSKLRRWRDRFENLLDRRQSVQDLEQVAPYLSEFQYQRFDQVEIPGQYLQLKDNNSNFMRIDRLLSCLDVVRTPGLCYRRMTFRSHDGSLHPFAVQYPAARHGRREERISQLFRMLNEVLSRKKESSRRGLKFHLPVAIPLAPHIRIVQDDPCYISLQGIYEDDCVRRGMHKDRPLEFLVDKIRAASESKAQPKPAMAAVKVDIFEAIREQLVPDTIMLNYFRRAHPSFQNFWLFRRQFTSHYAALTFMTYIMNINNRQPQKLYISKSTGRTLSTELLPAMASNSPVFHNSESVPFRFTPNIQTFIGPVGIEGVFSCGIMAIARSLTEPELDLDQYLCLFVRDELITWYTQQHRLAQDNELRDRVVTNVEITVRRSTSLAHVAQGNIPANQTIIDLISQAVNPRELAQMDMLWQSWL